MQCLNRYATPVLAVCALGLVGIASPRANAQAVDLVRWNFNDVTATEAMNATSRANLADSDGGLLSATFQTNFDFSNGAVGANTGINHNAGSPLNAFGSEVAGQDVTLIADSANTTGQSNNGKRIGFALDTTGYRNITFSLANRRSNTGFNLVQFAYSLNGGTTFINFGAAYDPGTAYTVQSFDLSSISGLANNPNAAFRLTFDGATNSGGNARLDNLRVQGTAITVVPEAGSVSLLTAGTTLLGGVLIRRKRTTK